MPQTSPIFWSFVFLFSIFSVLQLNSSLSFSKKSSQKSSGALLNLKLLKWQW